jgi:hypothetical protein
MLCVMMVFSVRLELTVELVELMPRVDNTACACDSNWPRKSGSMAITETCSTESLKAP